MPKVDFKQPTLAPAVPFWATLRSLARIALFRSLPPSWSLRLCSETRRFEFHDHPSRKARLAALLRCVAPEGVSERRFQWLLLLSRGTRRLGSTTYAPVFRRSKQWLLRSLRPEGLEILDEAKRSGRGVIILGTHAGMNAWIGPTLTQLGYPVRFMQRVATTEETLLLFRMDRWVERVLPFPAPGEEGVHLKRLHDLLRQGEWIQHAADAADWASGVEGRFLGHTVRCCRAPWSLGRLTGAPLIPVLLLADEQLRLHLSIERPIYVGEGTSSGLSAEAAFQAYLDAIGKRLAAVPWNLSLLFDWERLLLQPAH